MENEQEDKSIEGGQPSMHNAVLPNAVASIPFSEVEDSIDAFDRIKAIAVKAGNRAAIAAKKAGFSRTYIIRKGQFVNISSKGQESEVVPIVQRQSYYVAFKPGTVFHARKK